MRSGSKDRDSTAPLGDLAGGCSGTLHNAGSARLSRRAVTTRALQRSLPYALVCSSLLALLPLGAASAAAPAAQRNVESFQLLPDPAAPVAPAPLGEVPATVRVQRFEVAGNRLLPTPMLQAVLAAWLGERKPLELSAAALAVQQAYRDAGYGGVVAYLPSQNVRSGVVRVEVLEGRIEAVKVSGHKQFSEAQIRAALSHLQSGQTPRLDLIDSQLQMLNENPAHQVRLLLRPGLAKGGVQAEVDVHEAPLARWNFKLDNGGAAANGRWRAAVGGQMANVFGLDHLVAAELQTSIEHPSALAVVSGNYRVPFYQQHLLLDAYAARSDADAGRSSTAAGDLQFSGRGRIAGLRLQGFLPRWGERDQRVIVSLEERQYLNQCSIEGLPAGACGSAGASVSVQPLSLAYLISGGGGGGWRYSLQPSLHHNLALGGAHGGAAAFEQVREAAQPRYTVARLQGSLQALLPKGWTLAGRVNAQAADGPLVPGEQLGLGGMQGVRGFEERELLGDDGLQLSLELGTPNLAPWVAGWFSTPPHGPASAASETAAELRLLAFADGGWVHNRGGLPYLGQTQRCHSAAVGLGLRWAQGRWQAQLDLAQALTAGLATARHDQRGHFSLQISF